MENTSDQEVRLFQASSSNWNLPQTIAWASSQELKLVSDSKLILPWKTFYPGRQNSGRNLQKEIERRAAFGWLYETVAMKYCQCENASDRDYELWETCVCVRNALNAVLDGLRSGGLAAFDESTGLHTPTNSFASIRYETTTFALRGPSSNLRITFQQTNVMRYFGQILGSKMPITSQVAESWIKDECVATNINTAFAEQRGVFGDRRLTYEAFKAIWKEVKGSRGPGAPKKVKL